MSTHRRAWKQRAGVVVALVAGALLTVPATPALAAKITSSDGSVTIDAGRSSRISVQVNPDDGEKTANISVTGLPQGVSCGGCGEVDFGLVPGPQRVTLTLSASDDAPAANGTRATVRVEGDGGSDSKPLSVTVNAKAAPTTSAPQEAQTVTLVSGKVVVAANSDAVPNAVVMLRDSQGHQYQTTSDGSGNYRFSGSSSRPISPGRIDLGASKDNIVATKTINASAGQSLTGQRIALAIKVEVSPSATPSATDEALPTDEVTEEAADESADAAAPGQSQAASDGGGATSFIIILLGGLLVAAGVGTIVLLWMRRKNADEEDDEAPAGAAAGAVPGARGAFRGADDQTRVVNRVGAAGPDPTMVGGTSLSDAPTMMHRPIVDDVPPDPYGAPPQPYGAAGAAAGGWAGSGYGDEPAQGGYGQQGGYGNAPSSGGGYGNAPASGGGYGGAPSADAGYGAAGAAAGGYGNAPASGGGYGSRDYNAPAGGPGYAGQDQGGGYGERYDEPTGRYTGESTGAYAPAADPYPTSTYQPEQGHGYGQPDPAPYGRGQEPAGGYGGGNGYGAQGGGYDAGGQQPGYDNGYGAAQGGYDQQQGGGYGAGQGGYDQPAGGYGAAQGGYGQQGGYDQEPPQQRTGGYDDRGYDQQQGGGYYGDQAQAGRARPDAAPQQDRGGRRLDWLDD
ncbi:carboxypeptidase-like regulatory domain-containing protein [Micromonospora purpureochromogenes]|uniref:carboxypeptidase-like regulatory domain-containing protein n=1 Tax=Micromonospora purpureochromogenes TaxID=47872 RepID=UPI0033C0A5EF